MTTYVKKKHIYLDINIYLYLLGGGRQVQNLSTFYLKPFIRPTTYPSHMKDNCFYDGHD